jgi:putative membrane protein
MVRTSGLVALLFALAPASRGDDTKPFTDAEFVKDAASGGMLEVELGKVAAAKAKNADVKAFAERMVKDHSAANEKLKAAAKAAGHTAPTELNDKHQKTLDKFKDYKGTDFDKDYVECMVKDHEEAAKAFEKASKEAKDAGLKRFAADTLPVVKQHLEVAKKLPGGGK